MKKKVVILCTVILGLMIIGYTGDRVYHAYLKNHEQTTVKNNEDSDKTTDDIIPTPPENIQTPSTDPPKENITQPPSVVEEKAAYKKGDTGEKIIEIQKRLVKYGYEIDVDGNFGNDTFNAIWDFQKRLGLSLDGVVGPETFAKLKEEPTEKTKYTPPVVPAFNNNATQSNLEKYLNENTFKSNTNYFIWVDLANQKVNLFTGSYQNWHLVKSMSCSSGKASTPTVKGSFSVEGKGEYFRVNSNVICKYYTQFYGNYLFHTVLLDNKGNIVDGTLGTPVSHGCIRLEIEDAKYIYDNVPLGTFVWIK